MIAVNLIGGLGNQMFQYATARALAEKHKTNVLLDTRTLNEYQLHKHASLEKFNIKARPAKRNELYKWPNWMKSPCKGLQKLGVYSNRYFEETFHYSPKVMELKNNTLIEGYFQSERYFLDIRKMLLSDFTLKEKIPTYIRNLEKKIKSSESVMIHVRRGDYISNPQATITHGPCSPHYYKNAIERIEKDLSSPKYFVFSDDINWVKNNLFHDLNVEYITGNETHPEFDIHLMSCCNNHIIANSSFSWWGAWLSQNDSKVIIYPKPWFNDKKLSATDVSPKNWLPFQK